VFVLAGLLLLAALLIVFAKSSMLLKPGYTLHVRTSNVGGLKSHAQVLMSGVQIGTVAAIHLSPTGTNVVISLRIFKPFEIHQDARFVIESANFLGDQYVAILPTDNKAPLFEDGGEARTEPPFNIQEVARAASGFIRKIDETATKLNEAIAEVRAHVLDEHTLTNFSASISNLRDFSEHATEAMDDLRALVVTNGPAVGATTSNLVFVSDQIGLVASGITNFLATNSPAVNRSLENVEAATRQLNELMADARSGKGLAGALLENDELSSSVSLIASNLSLTTSNLNRLGLWGILWQHKPPRTNTVATARKLESPKEKSE
jgi:virulence factor Mce-like protein